MKQKLLIIFFGFLALNLSLLIGCSSLKASNPSSSKAAYIQSKEVVQPRTSVETQQLHYGVSTQGFHTTKASEKILSEGGNLIDAFVAASFMISVERPHSTGIGGGGFFLFHEGSTGKVHAVDFRERAPGLAHKNLFLDAQGNYLSTLSKEGALSVATPGLVLGLWEIHKKFGKQPWKKLLEPSIQLADQGFEVYETLAAALKNKKNLIESNMAARKIFLKPNLEPYSVGDVLYQKDLAKTLKRIAQKGALDFYQGQLAHQMIKSLQQKNGIISPQDLKNYTVKWRTPVVGSFLDYQIYSMPPPSSGGIHILQFLNFLAILEEVNSWISSVPSVILSIKFNILSRFLEIASKLKLVFLIIGDLKLPFNGQDDVIVLKEYLIFFGICVSSNANGGQKMTSVGLTSINED